MNREPNEYRDVALTIVAASFDTKEKDRHYRELLAHMRAQFRERLSREEELRDLYRWIVSLIDKK